MIFDIESWLWKSEFCDLHSQIHIWVLICKDLLKYESTYFHSINPGIDAEVAEKILNVI